MDELEIPFPLSALCVNAVLSMASVLPKSVVDELEIPFPLSALGVNAVVNSVASVLPESAMEELEIPLPLPLPLLSALSLC